MTTTSLISLVHLA